MKSKEVKDYLKARKPFKKVYKKIAKNAAPWDYSFLLDFIITNLEDMENYYREGNCVDALEDEVGLTRYQICHKALALYKSWNENEIPNIELEEKLFNDFWSYLGKYLLELWD